MNGCYLAGIHSDLAPATRPATLAEGLPGVTVELVQWPHDVTLRSALARAGVARLLLVAPDAEPPMDVAVDEDWIRTPADERDIIYRAKRLSSWMAQLSDSRLVLDEDVAHRGGKAVVLGRSCASLLATLLEHRSWVSRADLELAVWPSGPPSARALDNLLYRLRTKLEPLGVSVRTAPGRGVFVEADDPSVHR